MGCDCIKSVSHHIFKLSIERSAKHVSKEPSKDKIVDETPISMARELVTGSVVPPNEATD